ncbi:MULTISPECIES: hypothetical protein [Thermomonospora]|uniref:hypothetical protein n=1 Tax=Thermomonospora TaxID=2019 RepID=UPI0011D26008|nr:MULTISPECIES: hypothetical protein [Thermomonospora]
MLTASVIALAACGGGDGHGGGSPAAAGGHGAPGGQQAEGGSSATETSAPLPKVQPSQVKALVGTWVSRGGPEGQPKDYFVFKADGTATWMARKQTLWSGQVIPEGNRKFRFSWNGGDPKDASYWGVTLNADGKSLIFNGTNQTYTKVTS